MARSNSKVSPKTRASGAVAHDTDGAPLQTRVHRPRICFERIIPDALDPEQHARRALRSEMVAAHGGKLDASRVAQVARMALIKTKKWGPGYVLKCRFLDGSAKMKKKVRSHAREWEKHANIKIKFVTKDPADLRISFYADEGSWSAVGRDALNTSYFPLHQPTMNFGWVRDDSDPVDDRAVILHEFGHALGCIHEHQSPTFDRKWNKPAVIKSFEGPPNFWDEDAIVSNVLNKYSPKGIQATAFDPQSIMLYQFDAELFADGKGPTNVNTTLSTKDREMIARMYPKVS